MGRTSLLKVTAVESFSSPGVVARIEAVMASVPAMKPARARLLQDILSSLVILTTDLLLCSLIRGFFQRPSRTQLIMHTKVPLVACVFKKLIAGFLLNGESDF